VDLSLVRATGPKQRITKEDILLYVKTKEQVGLISYNGRDDHDDDSIDRMNGLMFFDEQHGKDDSSSSLGGIDYSIDEHIINGRYGPSPIYNNSNAFINNINNNNNSNNNHSSDDNNFNNRSKGDTRRSIDQAASRYNNNDRTSVHDDAADDDSNSGGAISSEERLPIRGVQRMMFKSMTKSLEVGRS
jgi:hypothetical protein